MERPAVFSTLSLRSWSGAQRRQEILDRPRIQDVFFRQPGPPQLPDSVTHRVQAADVVRVGIDHNLATQLPGPAQVDVAQVKPVGIGIMFHRHSELRRLLEHSR